MAHKNLVFTQAAMDAVRVLTVRETETESSCSDMIDTLYASAGYDARAICPDDPAARLGSIDACRAWLLSSFTQAGPDEPVKVGDIVHFSGNAIGVIINANGTMCHLHPTAGYMESQWEFISKLAQTVRMYHDG